MTIDTGYDCAEEIAYAMERANAEGSIPLYLEKEYKNERSIEELISDIVILHDVITCDELEGYTGSSSDEEYEYIAKKTGYSIEIIELVAWFYDCCLMENDRSTMCGVCPNCGHDVLYIREDRDEMFCSFVECDKCKACFSYEEFSEYGPFFDHNSDEDFNNRA